MLKENMQQLIRDSLSQLNQPVRLVLFTADKECDACPDAVAAARAIKAAAPKVALEMYDLIMDRDKSEEYGIRRVPSFVVQAQDGRAATFSGAMEGVSLVLLLDALANVAGGRPWYPEKIASTLRQLEHEVPVQVLLENDCSLCRPAAETAIGLALTNKLVMAEIIVADDFPELLSKHRVKVLPYILFGPKLHLEGHAQESTFLEMIFQAEGEQSASDRRCVVCGSPSPDIICTGCKTKIQAEALSHKRKDERSGETGTVVEPHKHG